MHIIKPLLLIVLTAMAGALLGQNARYNALGNASSVLYGAWSVADNQAGIATLESPTAMLGYENKFQLKETSTQLAAFILPTKTGNFGLSYERFGYQLYSENNIGLTYARNLGRYVSFGVQFDYLYYQQSEDYGNRGAFLFETGMIVKPIEHFFIGVHLYNPTRVKLADYNNERVPTRFRFGLGYYFSDKVVLTIETEKDIENKARIKGGLEYEPLKNLFLRTGFKTNSNQFSLGIGYSFRKFTTDIAFVTHETLRLSTQISLKYAFNK